MEKCHACQMAMSEEESAEATTTRWIEHAWGNAESYDVPLCEECAKNHDDYLVAIKDEE